MYYRHKVMPEGVPGIDVGEDFAGMLQLCGAEKAHRYVYIGVAERFRQELAKEKAKSKDGKLSNDQVNTLCALTLDTLLELPAPPYLKAIKELAGLPEGERSKALADLKVLING